MHYRQVKIKKEERAMHKFFTPKNLFYDDYALIEGDDVKHIYKVLRLAVGEKVSINNLKGEEFLGEIEDINKLQVKVKIINRLEINNESLIKLHLYQGLPKAGKMDLIVQKATELGITSIRPVITSRVDVVIKGEFKKLDRLQRIILEACKQSKRSIIPEVKEPMDFNSMLQELELYDSVIVPYENACGYGLKAFIKGNENKSIKNIAIVVGPEGGFEEEEINGLREKGAEIITLGPRILRTETAGFILAALLQYELGDIGGEA